MRIENIFHSFFLCSSNTANSICPEGMEFSTFQYMQLNMTNAGVAAIFLRTFWLGLFFPVNANF